MKQDPSWQTHSHSNKSISFM